MSYRNIEVKGQEWKYKVGKSFCDIRDPDGKGYKPHITTVAGVTEGCFEENHIPVKPSDIKRYILEKIG